MRGWRWLIALAVGLLAGGGTWGVLTMMQPTAACGCRGAPYLDEVDDTAAAWVAAIDAKDVTTAWGLLTLEAQQRRESVEKFEEELPALATRFNAAEGAVWQRVYEKTQGFDTPSISLLVLVSPDPAGLKAVSAVVVHSQATQDDPGRVDPDLGEGLKLTPIGPRLVEITNTSGGTGLRFLALPALDSKMVWLTNTGTGGGLYRLAQPASVSPPGKPVLVLATIQRTDGKYAFGAAAVQF